MTDKPDQANIRAFYNALSGKRAMPLEPDDPFYVPILQNDPARDPILELKTCIDFAESESINLLTGFRGNGKSTELRRLRRLLEQIGCRVFLVNMLDYVIMSKPLELSDFILSLMTALAHATEKETGLDEISISYWEKLKKFLKAEIQSDDLRIKIGSESISAELSTRLKIDPIFKDKLQQRLRGHLTSLVQDAREYVTSLVQRLRDLENNPDLKVVLLVDSMEQIRGMGDEAQTVHRSVVDTFSGQAENLSFPLLHLVYTVPPYLIPLVPNFGRSLGGCPIAFWPNVHVRCRDGSPDATGVSTMKTIVEKRYAQWSKFFNEKQIQRLAEITGGDIRDYFRLIRECLVSLSNSQEQRVTDEMISYAQQRLLSELVPIAADDAEWLARIHNRQDTDLGSIADLPRLARFLDSNLIMNYQNGETWYDIHPLIIDEISKLSRRAAQRP